MGELYTGDGSGGRERLGKRMGEYFWGWVGGYLPYLLEDVAYFTFKKDGEISHGGAGARRREDKE
ncbi:MAG: hypothetical protein A2Z96_06160 [Spirochaetes bacterium GWB1_48_6]|nr:MAG: hypothetical protein A2Z96_06160 [Spirochaetes bacterium GWB1_48_6]